MKNSSPTLSSYLARRLAEGRSVFTVADAQRDLGIEHGAFLDAAEKLQKSHRLFRPRHGFYVIVPPQYLNWESPPPTWFIDDMMRHENQPYYVGLLKAAEMHGASHQAVMEFQVVTNKRIPEIRAGRSRIVFYYRKDLATIKPGIEETKTPTGRMQISSIELTILDLLRYPQASAGLDNVATIISDLGPKIRNRNIIELSRGFERSTLQRAGFMFDLLKLHKLADQLYAFLAKTKPLQWAELGSKPKSDDGFVPPLVERNERWRIIVRHKPEPES